MLGVDDFQRLERIQALAGIGLWEWHPQTGDMYWSNHFREMFGFAPDEPPDYATFRSLVVTDDLESFDLVMADALERQQQFHTVQRMYLADRRTVRVVQISGEVARADRDAAISVLATSTDVTEQHQARTELAHLATHDALTGLRNRRAIMAALSDRLAQHASEPTALLLIDIDHFKDINDLRGHAIGDQVMRALATQLDAHLPDGAELGRLGGDEFAVVLPDHDRETARAVAERLCDVVNGTPMMTAGGALRLTVSIGVAGITGPTDNETVLANADLALYEAKNAGRNCTREFRPEQHARASRRLSVQQRLAEALDTNGLSLLAQPIVDLATDEISAWELLLRLRDGHGPQLPPSEFLPTAERSSLATRVDRWVVARAIAALSAPVARRRGLCLQVNVTSRSLEDATFGDTVLDALRSAGVSPHRLGFEITETATMGNVAAVRGLVERLGNAGCPIVLDDFGTGFGSLVSLRHVPFTAIKVAGAFMQHAGHPNLTLVDGIVRLARGLGMQVIAEQVDQLPLLEALRDAGVRGAQGYLLGAPRPLDDIL
jgi:diguanylate cyclase (GGDEF)-like protein/PAS domain S-box-containing protein